MHHGSQTKPHSQYPNESTTAAYEVVKLGTLFKDDDPISLQLIFPGAIQTCEQYNNYAYIYTKQHSFIGQSQANTTYTFLQNISINTHN